MIDITALDCLSPNIQLIVKQYPNANEIRLRKNKPLCITENDKNYILNYYTTPYDIEYSVNKFCEGSVHAHYENIKNGFISFGGNYRIGVCGKAVVDNDKITNISEINSLNIRIPSRKTTFPVGLLENLKLERGALIYSPPGVGKTTLLKEIIRLLSLPPYNKRLSVIDCKNEIYSEELHRNCPIDFFSGYPKYKAIEIAIKTMSPQIIVCDEIGLNDELNVLSECKNCGIILICTAHAGCINELFLRENIKAMHKQNIFEGYLGINFTDGKRIYKYTKKEEIRI